MPKLNKPRSIHEEDNVATRVAYEREAAGMTYAGLASRMAKAGCPIDASAIYKIEKGAPRRRITVDELVAFARVFGLTIDELLEPMESVIDRELRENGKRLEAAVVDLREAAARVRAAFEEGAILARANPVFPVGPKHMRTMVKAAADRASVGPVDLTDAENEFTKFVVALSSTMARAADEASAAGFKAQKK